MNYKEKCKRIYEIEEEIKYYETQYQHHYNLERSISKDTPMVLLSRKYCTKLQELYAELDKLKYKEDWIK